MELGQILIDVAVSESSLDSIEKAIQQRASTINKISVSPGVNDKSLTGLNKHLDLKVEHLLRVNNTFKSNPITPFVNFSQLDKLDSRLHVATHQVNRIQVGLDAEQVYRELNDIKKKIEAQRFIVSPIIDTQAFERDVKKSALNTTVTLKENTTVKGDYQELVKAVYQVRDAVKANKPGIFSGFNQAIGQSIASGLNAQLKKAFGFNTADIGKGAVKAVQQPLNLLVNENPEFKEYLSKKADQTSKQIRQFLYKIGDAATAAIDEEDLSLNKVKVFKEKLIETFKLNIDLPEIDPGEQTNIAPYIASINKNLASIDPLIPQLLHKINESSKKFAAQFPNEVKQLGENLFNPRVLHSVLDPIGQKFVSSYRLPALQERAIPLVEQRVAGILNGERVPGQKAGFYKDVNESTERVILVANGYVGRKGAGSSPLAKNIREMNLPNTKVNAITSSDTDFSPEVQKKYGEQAISMSLAKPNLRGYSQDAIEMAAQMIAAITKNSKVKGTLLGFSGGGYAAEEAKKILDMMGYGKNVEHLSVGTPDIIAGLTHKNTNKIFSQDDALRSMFAPHYKTGVIGTSQSNQQLPGYFDHNFLEYQKGNLPELKKGLLGSQSLEKLPEQKLSDIVNFSKTASKYRPSSFTDSSEMLTFIRTISTDLQALKETHLETPEGTQKVELSKAIDSLTEVIIRFGKNPGTGDMKVRKSDAPTFDADLKKIQSSSKVIDGLFAQFNSYKEEGSNNVNKAAYIKQTIEEQKAKLEQIEAVPFSLFDRHKKILNADLDKLTGALDNPSSFDYLSKKDSLPNDPYIQKMFKGGYAVDKSSPKLEPSLFSNFKVVTESPQIDLLTPELLEFAKKTTEINNAFTEETKTIKLHLGQFSEAYQVVKQATSGKNQNVDFAKTQATTVLENIPRVKQSIADVREKYSVPGTGTPESETLRGLSAQAGQIEKNLNRYLASKKIVLPPLQINTDPGLPIKFEKIGKANAQGLALGMDKDDTPEMVMAEKANSVIEEAKKTFDTHSPSRVFFRIGEMIVQGLEGGLSGLKDFDFSSVIDKFKGLSSTEIFDKLIGKIGQLTATGLKLSTVFFVIAKAVPMVVDFAKKSVETSAEMEQIDRRLKFASGGGVEGERTANSVKKSAKDLKLNVKDSANSASEFLSAVQGTSLEGDVGVDTFQNFQKYFASRGGSQDQQNRASLQLEQMAAIGKIQYLDLKPLSQAVPGIQGVLARSQGVSTGELNKRLNSDEGLGNDALVKFSQQAALEAQAGLSQSLETTNAAVTNLDNSVLKLQTSFGDFLSPFYKNQLNSLAETVNLVADNAGLLIQGFIGLTAVMTRPIWGGFADKLGRGLGDVIVKVGQFAKEWINATKFEVSQRGGLAVFKGQAMSAFRDIQQVVRTTADFVKPFLAEFLIIETIISLVDKLKISFSDLSGEIGKSFNSNKNSFEDFQKNVQNPNEKATSLTDNPFERYRRDVVKNPLQMLNPFDNSLAQSKKTSMDQVDKVVDVIKLSKKTLDFADNKSLGSDIKKVNNIDKRLQDVQNQRSYAVEFEPQNEKKIKALTDQQNGLLKERYKAVTPITGLTSQINERIGILKQSQKVLDELKENDNISAGNYTRLTAGISDELGKLETKQRDITKAVGETTSAYGYLKKELLATSVKYDDLKEKTANSLVADKTAISSNLQLGTGDRTLLNSNLDLSNQTKQYADLSNNINQRKSLLKQDSSQSVLKSFGVTDETGSGTLNDLMSRAIPDQSKFIIGQVLKVREDTQQLNTLRQGIAESRLNIVQNLREQVKQVNEFYTGLNRQVEAQAIESEKTGLTINASKQQTKLRQALTGGYDTIVSQFVESIISSIDSSTAISTSTLDAQNQLLANRNTLQDNLKAGYELSKSLPGFNQNQTDTAPTGLTKNLINPDTLLAPLKASLQSSLQPVIQQSNNIVEKATNKTTEVKQQVVEAKKELDGLSQVAQTISDVIKSWITDIKSIPSILSSFFDSLDNFFTKSDFIKQLETSANQVVENLGNAYTKTDRQLTDTVNGIETSVSNIFTQTIPAISDELNKGIGSGITLLNDAASSVANAFLSINSESISKLIADIQSGLQIGLDTVTQDFSNATKSVMEFFSGGIEGIISNVSRSFNESTASLSKGVNDAVVNFGNGISKGIDNFVSGINNAVNSILEAIKNFANAITSFNPQTLVQNTGNAAGNAAVGVGNTMYNGLGAIQNWVTNATGIGKTSKYQIFDSNNGRNINSYDDVTRHHANRGREAGRNYGNIGGKQEEINAQGMAKKDMVLKQNGADNVPIPAPASGFARRYDPLGQVGIYDQAQGGNLLAKVLHLASINVKDGQQVKYGETLGIQGTRGGGSTGVHLHVEAELERLRKYVADLKIGNFSQEITKTTKLPPFDGRLSQRAIDHEKELLANKSQTSGDTTGLTPLGKKYLAASQTKNFQAMAYAIGIAETGDILGKNGMSYGAGAGDYKTAKFKNFNNMSVIPASAGGAFGNYQINQQDNKEAQRLLGVRNLSKRDQDIIGAWRLDRQNALDPVLKGDLQTAMQRGGKEFGSFEGAPVGGHSATGKASVMSANFNSYLQKTQGGANNIVPIPQQFGQIGATLQSGVSTANQQAILLANKKDAQIKSQQAAQVEKDRENQRSQIEKAVRQLQEQSRNLKLDIRNDKKSDRDTSFNAIFNPTIQQRNQKAEDDIKYEIADMREAAQHKLEGVRANRVQAENVLKSGTLPGSSQKITDDAKKELAAQLPIYRQSETELEAHIKRLSSLETQRLSFQQQTANREEKLRTRDQTFSERQRDIDVLQENINKLSTLKTSQPDNKDVQQIPNLQRVLDLKKETLSTDQERSRLDDDLFAHKITQDSYNKQVAALSIRSQTAQDSIKIRGDQALTQQEIDKIKRDLDARKSLQENTASTATVRLQGLLDKPALTNPQDLSSARGDVYKSDLNAENLNYENKRLEYKQMEASGAASPEKIKQLYADLDKLHIANLDQLKAKYETTLSLDKSDATKLQIEARTQLNDQLDKLNQGRLSQLESLISKTADANPLQAIRQSQLRQKTYNNSVSNQQQEYLKQSNEIDDLEINNKRTPEQIKELRANLKALNEISLEGFKTTLNDALNTDSINRFQKKIDNITNLQYLDNSGLELQKARTAQQLTRGGNPFAINKQQRQTGATEENNRYLLESLEIDKKIAELRLTTDIPDDKVSSIKDNLQQIHAINLDNLNDQFKTFGATIDDVAKSQIQGLSQSLADLVTEGGDVGTMFNNIFKSLANSVIKSGLDAAIGGLTGSLFGGTQKKSGLSGGLLDAIGGIFGGGGGLGGGLLSIFGFSEGGTVPAVSGSTLRNTATQIGKALKKEGSDAVLATLTPGERVLTKEENKVYNAIYPNGIESQYKAYNFNDGGNVGDMSRAVTNKFTTMGTVSNSPIINIQNEHNDNSAGNERQSIKMIRAVVVNELKRQNAPGGINNRSK